MKKFYNKLLDYVISPNQLYIMYCIREQIEARFVNLHVELRAQMVLQEVWLQLECGNPSHGYVP